MVVACNLILGCFSGFCNLISMDVISFVIW